MYTNIRQCDGNYQSTVNENPNINFYELKFLKVLETRILEEFLINYSISTLCFFSKLIDYYNDCYYYHYHHSVEYMIIVHNIP